MLDKLKSKKEGNKNNTKVFPRKGVDTKGKQVYHNMWWLTNKIVELICFNIKPKKKGVSVDSRLVPPSKFSVGRKMGEHVFASHVVRH